jgi:hypothetical protein
MRDKLGSQEYDFGESESHGLKQLITLLILIYDDTNDVMIIDEPELHLHPQYQRFLLQEIQRVAGPPDDNQSKAFFIITHSPSMIDFRNLDDLKNVYSFRSRSSHPCSVDEFDGQDKYHISKLLPRLNTRHKELLFSHRPILVEGYTDEEIFSIAIEKHDRITDDPKSTIIGVGGKDNFDPFLRFCWKLGIQPRFIADLDALLNDSIESISNLDEVNEPLQKDGQDSDLASAIGKVKQHLNSFADTIQAYEPDADDPEIVREVCRLLESTEDPDKKRYFVLRALQINDDDFESILERKEMAFVQGRVNTIIGHLSDCGYHFLNSGELEDYLGDDSIEKRGGDDKRKIFKDARDGLLEAENAEDVSEVIGELESVLESISISQDIDIVKHMNEPVADWMHDVQKAVRAGEINSIDDLESHDKLRESQFKRLFEVDSIEVREDGFNCEIQLNRNLDPRGRTVTFSDEDPPASIDLSDY